MTEDRKIARRKLEMIYENTMELYATLKNSPVQQMRRAEFKHGEVAAEAIDFLCDVELKAKKHLSPSEYSLWFVVVIDPEQFHYVSERIKQSLGRIFQQNRLDMTGDYKRLYFKVKNQQAVQELTPREDLDGQ